jgi:hypothetical protein
MENKLSVMNRRSVNNEPTIYANHTLEYLDAFGVCSQPPYPVLRRRDVVQVGQARARVLEVRNTSETKKK